MVPIVQQMRLKAIIRLSRALRGVRTSPQGAEVPVAETAGSSCPRVARIAVDLPIPERWRGTTEPGQYCVADILSAERFVSADGVQRYPILDANEILQLPGWPEPLTVLGPGGEGRRALVYRLADAAGRKFALKVVRDDGSDNQHAIALERVRAAVLLDHGLACAEVLDAGLDYTLKPWIEGEVGTAWIERGECADRDVAALAAFVQRCVDQRVAIHDFKAANLILTPAGDWVCVDTGAIALGEPAEEIRDHFARSVARKWVKRRFRWWLAGKL